MPFGEIREDDMRCQLGRLIAVLEAVYQLAVDRPRHHHIFRRVVAALTIGAFSGTVSAQPMRQLPLPVSDQGITSYRAYSSLPMGKRAGIALVNILSGNLVIESADLNIPSRGISLLFQRFYNSQNTDVGFFGQGWSSLLDARLELYP